MVDRMKVAVLILNLVAIAVGTSIEGQVEKLKQELVDLKEVMSLNLKSHWEELNHQEIVKLKKENVVLKAKLEKKIEKEELNPLKAKLEKIEKEDISKLRNPPFYHMCAYLDEDGETKEYRAVTYDKILYQSSHRCDEADVNLSTGVFTAGCTGTYTVTWSLSADNDVKNQIYLRKNEATIDASRHYTYSVSASASDTYTYDQGKV